ncbi:MAG: ribosome silencing factor [Chloroflexota bacterium]
MEQDTAALAHEIVDLTADRKAEDILLLDMRPASYVADYFVLCNGTSERHIKALADDIREKLVKEGIRPLHVEGTSDSGWILMDYGDVVVHIFSQEERSYYGLDRLWREAVPLLRIQ